ncbi:MAG: tetratricopeptide repeat protein [Gemmatimonadaceae bacterium]
MSITQLKKKAAEFEQKKQFDKAIQVYIQILNVLGRNVEEVDLALFNRVGDLLLRQGNVADALDYYERAVDRYADGGFFNNAIALCNKILRHSPGRATVYYKLGKISAHKGFTNDAKQNFLEYADRMQKSGRMDEAFRALKEFADLCPDQDDIRLMLADQLSKQNRGPEALEQLQVLFERYQDEGKDAQAQATLDRMKAIDPSFRPRTSGSHRRQKSDGLVFLDLGDEQPKGRRSTGPPAAPGELTFLDTGEDATPPPAGRQPPPKPSSRPAAPAASAADFAPPTAPSPAGFETTSFGGPPPAQVSPAELLGIERTAFEAPAAGPPPLNTPPMEPAPPTTDGGGTEIGGPATGFDFVAGAGFAAEPAAPTDAHSESQAAAGSSSPDGEGTPSFDFGSLNLMPDPSISGGASDAGSSTLDVSREAFPFDGMRVIDLDAPVASAFGGAALDGPFRIENEGSESLSTRDIGEPGSSTLAAAQSVEAMQRALADNETDYTLRRRLGEAMLESGDREGALRELEAAMAGFERIDDLDSAASIAEEIARLRPEAVRIHQKRVEYAFRTNDKTRLIGAYLDLGQALSDAGQPEKARAVYQRVLDLAPDDLRAQVALSALADATPTVTPAPPPVRGGPSPIPARPRATPTRAQTAAAAPGGDFIDLGKLLREQQGPRSTRIVVPEHEPTGDEEADFAEMLRRFKQGIAETVDAADYESHYDLGVAYKEMGLIDDAIAEFQKALRGPTNRLASYEALGVCFIQKGQFAAASALLTRALAEPGVTDDKAIGVLYLLGRASEELRRDDEAHGYYQRVMVMDIEFRDVAERLSALERSRR